MANNFEGAYIASCKLCDVEPCQQVLDAYRRSFQEADNNSGKVQLDLGLSGKILELFERRLTNSDVQALSAAVKASGILIRRLDISYNLLDDNIAEAITDILIQGQVVSLDLTSNNIGIEGLELILEAIGAGSCSLTELVVNSNPIGGAGGMALAEMLTSDESLVHLDIGSTEQNTDSLIALASALRGNSTVQTLNLDNPRLFGYDDETVVHIANMIRGNNSIIRLSLAKHGIRCTGASILSGALERNSSIRAVNLRCNQISIKGAKSLAKLILSNGNKIEELDMAGNRVADEGASAIGDALEFTDSLRKLDLQGNSIRDTGLSTIARGLAVNSSIVEIKLWGNHFGKLSSKLFFDMCNGRFKHTNVSLDFCPNIPEIPDEDEIHVSRCAHK